MNYATTGFTLQKLICDKFNIVPNKAQAINQFNASYDSSLKMDFMVLIDELFNSMQLNPIECTTFDVDSRKKEVPYNFILSDNSTLSIRTNINGSKVAPRVVGQAGFEKLNKYFGRIYGSEIKTQDDIKRLILEKIDIVLPVFFDFLFDADFIVWIYQDGTKYSYHLIKGCSEVDIDYCRENFSFTKDYSEWNESTTLKYRGVSIAEIQVHKCR